MPNRIEALLRERYDRLTVSERMIASYLLDNLGTVPFETAASIGARVGVSAMTVGRFLKALGYPRLSALKADLRDSLGGEAPWLVQPSSGADLDTRLQAETAALADVYRLATTPGWAAVVALLAGAGQVFVVGFQTERGLAQGFAAHLDYVRPGVRPVDASAGTYSEVLDAGPGDALVLIDIRRYSQHFRRLAEAAHKRGVPVVVVTDPYCPWARDLTEHILSAEVSFGHFWDMNSALGSLLNLLVDGVVRAIGEEHVHRRLATLSGAYDAYVGFQGRK